jgi:tetratricopeptide (TPR) repeat protein
MFCLVINQPRPAQVKPLKDLQMPGYGGEKKLRRRIMKVSKILAGLFILISLSVNSFAQGFGKPVDDGAGAYASELVRFHSSSVGNMLKRPDLEPFAVSFFGWRALTIARLPFNKFEGTHLHTCRLALKIYDKELDATLQTLADRPTSMTSFVEATHAEKAAIQKFVVGKYGGKYLSGINAILSGSGKAAPEKKDETAAWKYGVGGRLGELAGSITKWFAFPNHPKYDESISEYLRNLEKELHNAPKDAPPDFISNLKRLAAFSNKKFYSPQEREQIGLALQQTLITTLAFAKPLSKALDDFANTVNKMMPAPTKPTASAAPVRAPADTAKAKEIAEQYRQYGLKKFNHKLYDPAIDDYNRAAELDPNNPYIYANRGQAYLEKGEVDKAILDFTKALNLGGITADDHVYFNDRARAYFKKGALDLALADVNLAISLYAKNGYGYYLRGFIYKSAGNPAQAKADFQAALTINPNFQAAKDELTRLGN